MSKNAWGSNNLPESIDLQTLEFFATSIAALSRGEAEPAAVLDDVLSTFSADREQILREKAAQTGYADYARFEHDLLTLISKQMQELQNCRLTAAERAQHHLIKAL